MTRAASIEAFGAASRSAVAAQGGQVLIVIPTLDEAAHIGRHLDWLLPRLEAMGARLVVADGGSTDDTAGIVTRYLTAGGRTELLHNPDRLQSAAVNLAVERHAGDARWLIRLDAHADYPADYCDVLIAEAEATGADSIVVAMDAVGTGVWQGAIALAQNSRFGNGGSAHRLGGVGRWVDHGHHALMRIETFLAVGGYDPTFSHNEDAELDLRLRRAGARIWMTGQTRLQYHPRRTPAALARQYWRFGRGRARTLGKHGTRPQARQVIVMALAPALALAVLTPFHPAFAAPLLLWLAASILAGVAIAVQERDPRGLLAGVLAGIMQASWSAGFWAQRLGGGKGRP